MPHELRRTATSLAIASGANIKVVQTMLPRKIATMTWDLYGHLYDDELDALGTRIDRAARESAEFSRISAGGKIVELRAADGSIPSALR